MSGTIARLQSAASASLAIALACSLIWPWPGLAAQTRNQFTVTASLRTNPDPGAPATGFCIKNSGPGGFGATLTVVCSTGAVVDFFAGPWWAVHEGVYRYLFEVRSRGALLGTIDSYAGSGSETSLHVIELNGRKYLEMQVGW